jgi:hypothetical protein
MFGYFIGSFAVALPTLHAMLKKHPQRGWRYDWRQVLAHCPRALRVLLYAMIVYAFLNFVFVLSMGGKTSHDFGQPLSALTARAFSGHTMLLYLGCAAIMLSLYRGEIKAKRLRTRDTKKK